MRDAFASAVSQLPPEQVRFFEQLTAQPIGTLVDKALALDDATLRRVLDLGRGELGNLYYHPLNADGLHVLKWLVARDVVDRARASNGWASHARHDEFHRHGLLTKKLTHWHPNAQHVPLTLEEADLIALAAGWAQRPFGCSAAELHEGDATAKSGLAVDGFKEHIFTDDDDQYQLHIDVYMPNIKFMVFAERTRIETGPFHFVMGSHRPSESKSRWLFERTRHLTHAVRGQTAGAFRHVNVTHGPGVCASTTPSGAWCCSTRGCLEAAYTWQQRDLAERYGFPEPTPIIVDAGTLVVADTSAFHFRGLGPKGGRRARMANLVYRCKRLTSRLTSIATVPRKPVLACANGSEEVYRVLRNDARCSGPVGLLRDVPTHQADGTRVPRRVCDASVAETLGWSIAWDAEREEAYHRHSTEPFGRSIILTVGNVTFPAQHFWDAIVFDLFFNGAPRRPRRFFEAGARDGYFESNSLFFEKYLGFSGVLVEPTPLAKCSTRRNRPLATVVHGAFCTPGEHLEIRPNATSFFLSAHALPADCPLAREDWKAPCSSWQGLAAEHDLNRVDLWSLDIDNDAQQHKILKSIDWDMFDPVAIIVECKRRVGCETLLRERGYHTLVLENNQKHTYYGDVLAWKDTCRAWRE